MKNFIVAVPLFSRDMSVEAYRLCSRSGNMLFSGIDDFRGMASAIASDDLELVSSVGIAPFSGDKPLFAEFNPLQLLMGAPFSLAIPAEQLICVFPGDTPVDAAFVQNLQEVQAAGYRIAFDGVPLDPAVISLSDYLVLDYRAPDFEPLFRRAMPHLRARRAVIANVPDRDTFIRLSSTPNILFSGSFYSQPITQGAATISPLKINALQLLSQINDEDFDLTEVARVIERDPSLSISLLRSINSRSAGGNSARKIDSIRSAVAVLGQKELRRWATIAISMQMAEDRPSEITRLSLVRARFAENLAPAYELGIFAPSLFLAGLFSLLDVILEKPMPEAIAEVAVDARVKQALVDRSGELYEVLDLIYAYERADWDNVSINMVRNNVQLELILSAQVDALVWYQQLIDAMSDEFSADGPPETPVQVL